MKTRTSKDHQIFNEKEAEELLELFKAVFSPDDLPEHEFKAATRFLELYHKKSKDFQEKVNFWLINEACRTFFESYVVPKMNYQNSMAHKQPHGMPQFIPVQVKPEEAEELLKLVKKMRTKELEKLESEKNEFN